MNNTPKVHDIPSIVIQPAPFFSDFMAEAIYDAKKGRKADKKLIAWAELMSPEGIIMNNVFFYAVPRDGKLQMMITGIVSVVPSGDEEHPLTTSCPEVYFEMHEDIMDFQETEDYSRFFNTLETLLVDFYKSAEEHK